MDFYRSLEIGYQSLKQPNWAIVEQYLCNSSRWPNNEIAVYSGDEHTYLSVSLLENGGFLVYGLGLSETTYAVLIDLNLGDAQVRFWDGQEYRFIPQFACVHQDMMVKAMKYFYETGCRDEDLTWWEETYVFKYHVE